MRKLKINETSLYILLSIIENPLSGYEITRKIMEITNGRLKVQTGIMYPTLKKLLDLEMIAIVDVEKVERNKKIYRITELGIEIVNRELDQYEMKIKEIRSILDNRK